VVTSEDDGDDGDDARFDPPLPPDDRLWRHPSELGGDAPPNGPVTPDTPDMIPERTRRVGGSGGVALAGGAVGGVLVLAVLVMLGVFDRSPQANVIERVEEIAATDNQRALAEAALPAVVRVDVATEGTIQPGSAVAYRDDGHLLTTADLVTGADSVEIVTTTGTRLAAEIVGIDPLTDIAVLKVEEPVGATVVLGSASDLERGEQVLAISSPPSDAAAPTVTQGIVWATHVSMTMQDGSSLHDLLQASATVGVLSAGSAILDQDGALVGIMTARPPIADDSTDPESTGPYVIPVEYARHVADEIVEFGRADHPWLGLEGRDLTGDEDGREIGGAMVAGVASEGPAEAAGLEPGDVIVSLDGQPVADMAEFAVLLREHEPGDEVAIDYRRDDEVKGCRPQLAAWDTKGTTTSDDDGAGP
jgi:putative serine protease PepD